MPNSVRGFLQPYLHLWHLLISWRLQVLSSRRLRRLLQTIADYNAIFDSDFFRQYKPSATSFTIVFISSKI